MSASLLSVGTTAGAVAPVRLSEQTLHTIRTVLRNVFPAPVRIILFGSRVDPEAKGGDIDLLVIAKAAGNALARARLCAIARLQLALGEQHIDLIVTPDPDQDDRLVVHEALRMGVLL